VCTNIVNFERKCIREWLECACVVELRAGVSGCASRPHTLVASGLIHQYLIYIKYIYHIYQLMKERICARERMREKQKVRKSGLGETEEGGAG
jgi:hypothetical protein